MNSIIVNNIKNSTVLVCYGKLSPATIKGYNVVIVESKYYLPSDIRVLKSQNKKVFAYLSLGEVNVNATHYKDLKSNTLGKNVIWNSYYIDLQSEKTKDILMGIIDKTLSKGYDGLFFDNIDNFTIHGPQKNQKEELISLLKKIKEKYSEKEFIQNAGLDLLNETAKYMNAVLIESVATNYSFKEKKYQLRETKDFENYLAKIKLINETYNLPVILVEYGDTEVLYEQIENRINSLGFEYFIGTIDLQNVPKIKK